MQVGTGMPSVAIRRQGGSLGTVNELIAAAVLKIDGAWGAL